MGKRNAATKELFVQLDHYDRTLGTDELNLAEFPLASLASRRESGQNTLVFEDDIFDKGNGRKVHRSLMVTGSNHFGLPTAIDNDVLLVLVHLTNVRNGLKSKQVSFSRYELVKFMGWDLGGKSYKRLDESLQRWTSVTLHYKHAWWDCSGKRWQVRSFHVLESLELRVREEIEDDGLSSFIWSDVVFDSFQAGNLKRIDLDVYFRLELAVAKQIYRFLDKRFYRPKTLQFELRLFACEHIGLSRAYDTFDLKRKLQPAIEELEAIGFLAPLPVEDRYSKLAPGRWQILLQRAISRKERRQPPQSAMVSELTRRNVSKSMAVNLALSFSERHIVEKIELHDRLLERRDQRISKNPPGFLAAAIRNDYRLEIAESRDTSRRYVDEGGKKSRPADGAKETADNRYAVARQYWDSLTENEREELEVRAVSSGDQIRVQSYKRLRAAGSRLWKAVRDDLVTVYLERQGILASFESNPASTLQGKRSD